MYGSRSPKPVAGIARFFLFFCSLSIIASVGAAQEKGPDPWFPRERSGPNGSIIFYAPQIDSWKGFELIDVWQAFLAKPKGDSEGYYGSLHYRAKTEVDIDKREVLLSDIQILDLSIPKLSKDAKLYEIVKKGLTAAPVVVPLDLVLEYLPKKIKPSSVKGLNPAPPKIFYSTSPAILLFVDSRPLWVHVKGTGIEVLVNINWDVFREEGKEKPIYLRYQKQWLSSGSLSGPWKWAKELPQGLWRLPEGKMWSEVRKSLPSGPSTLKRPKTSEPKVFFTDKPAELLLFEGAPRWSPIGKTGIEYAVNTKQEVLRYRDRIYCLFSGRWFSASGFNGPWKWEIDLPEPFKNIPKDSKKGYLRKNIPGTREAWEAALLASIPRKATVSKDAAKMVPKVEYAGKPIFKPIEGTRIELAANTPFQVLKYGNSYYLCFNAMWFKSSSPSGPWELAASIPAEFSKIPPSSPAYNTTFVKIASVTPDTVTYTYTSGYEGKYCVHSTVVYGTGWYWPYSWWGWYDYYDHYYPYYPYPPTYGYGSWYDPETGRYGEKITAYGRDGTAAIAAMYNPTTGVLAKGAAVWDDDRYRGRGFVYNPNTKTKSYANRYLDLENREGWSNRITTRGDEWRYRSSGWKDGRLESRWETSYGAEGEVSRRKEGDAIKSEGRVEYKGREMTFESTRERQGDALVNKGTVTGEKRSAQFESRWEDGKGEIDIKGSEGGTGHVGRDIGKGEITGGGTFTKDGKTIKTEMKRSAEGVQRSYESSSGAKGVTVRQGDSRAFVGQTAGGDVYAGRDGAVYKKTSDGWKKVENPYKGRGAASTSVQRSRPVDTRRLNRDYQSRRRGYQRYQARQRRMGRPRMRMRGRRR